MGVRLTLKMKGDQGGAEKAQVVVLDDDLITLGRDQECQVVLAQQAVSRNHARISRDGSLFFVEDLGSSYGTLINGKKLPKGEKRLLRNGDTIAIAQFDVIFDRVADAADGAGGDTNMLSRKVVKEVMRGLTANTEQPYFRVMNGPREGQRIQIQEGQELVFGRDETANVVLKDDLVSRRHAKVRRDLSGTHVEDLGSRNGIKVNKKKAKKADLRDRDELEIGNVKLLYIDPSEVRETPIVMPSLHDGDDEEVEGTSVLAPDVDEPPSVEAPPPEGLDNNDQPSDAGENPEEPAPSAENPNETRMEDQDGPPPDDGDGNPAASFSDAPRDSSFADLQPSDGDGSEDQGDEGDKPAFDLKSRQTQIMLAVVGAMVIVGIVLIILLVVGA